MDIKLKLNYIVFLALLVVSSIVFITGLIKFPGFLLFFGFDPRYLPLLLINTLHDWGGVAILILVWIHIILNYKWIVRVTKKMFGRKGK